MSNLTSGLLHTTSAITHHSTTHSSKVKHKPTREPTQKLTQQLTQQLRQEVPLVTNRLKTLLSLCLISVLLLGMSFDAMASKYKVKKEIREGYREVNREKREAAIEVLRCKTKRCAEREIREGYREVAREKREARYEINKAIRKSKRDKHRNDSIIGGIIVGAAIVGAATVIAESQEE